MTRQIKIDEDSYIGGNEFIIIAGPCAVESEKQMDIIGREFYRLGIRIIRGGAFKPRTNPASFQGLGFEGLKILKSLRDSYGFKILSEILDPRDVERAYEYIDIYQIGSRNMQNYALLKEVGKQDKPVLLKRGMNATYDEWINASEYISQEGNHNIILCERGIRTFNSYTRNTLDLMSVPVMKYKTEYPVIVDPSHGTGRRNLILPAAKAALAIGANGVLIEVHPEPEKALSDGYQSLSLEEFKKLLEEINAMKSALKIN